MQKGGVEKLQHSDLAGIFGVGLADGHVRVLRRIGRFMNRERFRLGRHAEIVFEGTLIWIHGILMPENGAPEADVCFGSSHLLPLRIARTIWRRLGRWL